VSKEGYYGSGTGWTVFQDQILGKWQPWDSVTQIVLRPIGQPVALYAKTIGKLEIPAIQQACGYDLQIGDWVAPYGKGKIADLVFTLQERRYAAWKDFNVTVLLSFSNPLDGIQETQLPAIARNSVFKWERQAPLSDYQPSIKTSFSANPDKGYSRTAKDDQAYFFRVRTVEKEGRIVSALYGKIKGGIQIEARETKTGSIAFTYYINPTPLDRNLEWDTKRNLITGLNYDESPREP